MIISKGKHQELPSEEQAAGIGIYIVATGNIKIIIAAHKKYRMPTDPMYMPLHVGSEGKKDAEGPDLDLGYTKDNTGDNISLRNPGFCELTGLYWAWKNLDADHLGLVHYRRYFTFGKTGKDPFDSILSNAQAKELLQTARVLVPVKRRYYIETLYSHYAHTHDGTHLDLTGEIIAETYPQYLGSFQTVLKQTWGYMFNMMVMPRGLTDDYCSWLFNILFALEKKLDEQGPEEHTAFDARLYGRVSEILFNVWLTQKQQDGTLTAMDIREVPVIYMEPINWRRKILSFLQAKFFHKKYTGSF